MNQLIATAIILTRTDYGEADRILTVLTPQHGKLRLMAKGVRRIKSKLAGGIELFSVSDITFIMGRKDIGTLTSARLARHYGRIVDDITRVQLGYDLLRILNRNTEDAVSADYFTLLDGALQALDTPDVTPATTSIWFGAQLLALAGHTPNLQTDASGAPLRSDNMYDFSYDAMALVAHANGAYGADQIKFLRLIFGGYTPAVLEQVRGSAQLVQASMPLIRSMLQEFLRI